MSLRIVKLLPLLFSGWLLVTTASSSLAAVYYVDAVRGSDHGTGEKDSPWKTFRKARESVPGGAVVLVSGGVYPLFREVENKNTVEEYVTFRVAEGQEAVLAGLEVRYDQPGKAFLEFDGFNLIGSSGTEVVQIENVSHFRLSGSRVHSEAWASNGIGSVGARISSSKNVVFEDNEVYDVHRGFSIVDSHNVSILDNFIQPKAGTAIQYAGGNSEGLIRGNHIKGGAYEAFPANLDAVKDPHASMISVRSSGLDIVGNLMHGMGTSSGVMLYEPDAAGGEEAYSDIRVSNNVIYDVFNSYAIRIYNLGKNVQVVNNTIHSKVRRGSCGGITNDARYRYNTALAVHSISPGYDATGLLLYNNVLIGALIAPASINESNNVLWSWIDPSSHWVARPPASNSTILVSEYMGCGRHPQVFEDGTFFKEKMSFLSFSDRSQSNFVPAQNSPLIGFGDPNKQASVYIEGLSSDGFLKLAEREALENTAGAHISTHRKASAPLPPVLKHVISAP